VTVRRIVLYPSLTLEIVMTVPVRAALYLRRVAKIFYQTSGASYVGGA
jgi:hypothetical protein